jgi:Ca2+-binding RTX toxin-like protein
MSSRAGTSSIACGPRPLQMESLERRDLLSVAPTEPPQVYMDLDVLRIYGTSDAERVIVESYDQDSVAMVSVTVSDAADPTDQGTSYGFEAAAIRKIFCRLEEGNDIFQNDAGIFSLVLGNAGNDRLIGGSAYDRIFGGSHDDWIEGRGSRDVIQGAGGNDTIYGGDGNDVVKGQAGSDTLFGDAGDDEIHGGGGNDAIDCGGGADLAYGHTGNDTLHGGSGNDVLYGRNADDTIYGGEGDDRLYGGGQNDRLFGEAGLDRLFGTNGENVLDGGDGNDGIYGGYGDDQLSGGKGHDVIRGYAGNDTLLGQADNDRLFGGDGDDTIYGGDGADLLYGEAGNDGLFGGGAQTDALTGGEGSDRFLVHGTDTVEDKDALDAEVLFADGAGTYTATAASWTDAIIEKFDLTLAQMQRTAGSALVLADTLSSDPISLYLVESLTLGGDTVGLNYFDGYRREIYFKDSLSDESLAATIVHEFSHCWDSTHEGNNAWSGFQTLFGQSSDDADFTRDYGRNNAKED